MPQPIRDITERPRNEHLSQAQRRFVALDEMKDEYKRFIEDYAAARDEVVLELGSGEMFQDDKGIVYKTDDAPEGKFIFFDKTSIVRTRRDGETKGSLSMKEAQAAGFKIGADFGK